MKLSIIIPIYNNFDKLKTCLKSLKKQIILDLFDAEIILVDDGSFCHPEFISGSNKILKHPPDCSSQERAGVQGGKNISDNKKIKFYRIEHSGASSARNFGYSKSCGDYIFFCDADVIFLKNNALELMIKKLENNLTPLQKNIIALNGFLLFAENYLDFSNDKDATTELIFVSIYALNRLLEKDELPNMDLKKYWRDLLLRSEYFGSEKTLNAGIEIDSTGKPSIVMGSEKDKVSSKALSEMIRLVENILYFLKS